MIALLFLLWTALAFVVALIVGAVIAHADRQQTDTEHPTERTWDA